MAGGSVQPSQYLPPYMTQNMGVPPPVQYGTQARPPQTLDYGADVGSAIGGGIAALLGGGGAQQQGPQTPNFSDYLASLGLSGGDFGVNLPEAPDLTAGVQDQYGDVLGFLRNSIGRTENKGEKAAEDLKSIYGAMANMSKQSGKVIKKQGRKTTKGIKKTYANLEERRDESIEKDAGAVSRRLQQLGISSALPASTERLQKESAQDHRLIARQEGRAVASSKDQAANWANFAKTGAQTARLEGAQQRADLSSNIADAVFALQGQIAQTKAEKAAAMMQAQQAEYAMAADAAQAEQAAAMQKAGFAQDYQSQMLAAQAASQEAGGGEPKDLQGYDLLRSILGNEAKAEPGINRGDAANALESIQGIIPGMTPQGTDSYGNPSNDMTQQDFYSQLASQAEAAGIPPELYRALMSQQVYNQFYGGGG